MDLLKPDLVSEAVQNGITHMDVQQQAKAKIDTFPYTKYGTIHATVTDVSNDAVNDEKKGLIYTAHVKFDRWRTKLWI